MSRILMISDIHGCIEQFNDLLDAIHYNPSKDNLILLGDYVDRGPRSKETVERVKELVNNHNVIALRGNHDQRLVDLVRTKSETVQGKFLEHGGMQTLQSYCHFVSENMDEELFKQAREYIRVNFSSHIDFLESLPLYYEDLHHIYVHAGLNPKYINWREQIEYDFMYIKEEFHQSEPRTDKLVIFGHTRTIELHDSSDIWFGRGKIGIDGGCAYGMQLNCLICDEGIYTTASIKNLWNGD
ncbi:metallophosphoesterase family protein [Paenibacillus woosongensis]|uniref:Serine/threonine protein phosphatase n=1 Tax=Paenibacillus woosongensis TaxID=307580 RepID=A0ABQ4ML72_9BACL|nr:metallophosphoesterase family protein [Paenibacillus woosongensis]GIP56735.1 serine/threonine protein phosphatase [Paenibacillus woosongensis]